MQPRAVVIDPISNFIVGGQDRTSVKAMLMRLIDFFKSEQITALFTNLTSGGGPEEQTEIGVSSLMDTWLLLRDIELDGERNRCMYVLKSRGMAHSNQMREFLLTDHGVESVGRLPWSRGRADRLRPVGPGSSGKGRQCKQAAGHRT